MCIAKFMFKNIKTYRRTLRMMKILQIFNRVKNKILHEFLRLRVYASPLQYGINKSSIRDKKIIISLTSYPKRLPMIGLCIKSLLLQDMKADRILLWLGSDTNPEDIPADIEEYKKYGLEILYDPNKNMKSHKKYYYAMKEFLDSIVITVDDDLIYDKKLVSSLVDIHNKFPKAVCARRVHRIKLSNNGNILPYFSWEGECNCIRYPSHELFATTGAGTLFPPNSLPDVAFDTALVEKLCMNADDVWIKIMLLLNNVKVVWVPSYIQMPTTIKISQETSLQELNVGENLNDVYINNLTNYFNINWNDILKSQ